MAVIVNIKHTDLFIDLNTSNEDELLSFLKDNNNIGFNLILNGYSINNDNTSVDISSLSIAFNNAVEQYKNHISSLKSIDLKPIDTNVIKYDYIPIGEYKSYLSYYYENNRNINIVNTEPIKTYGKNISSNGTTGKNSRLGERDVRFHTFVNPFGTSSLYKVRVDTNAEASYLYEQGLKGTLDWDKFFNESISKNRFKGYSDREINNLKQDLISQFQWIREELLENNRTYTHNTVITTNDLIISDTSFGKTVYDPVLSPSSAHILLTYITNPILFYATNDYIVLNALNNKNKQEELCFDFLPLNSNDENNSVNIIIDGSQTFGGRVDNSNYYNTNKTIYKKDIKGNLMLNSQGHRIVDTIVSQKQYQMKTQDEIDKDYNDFKDRLNTVLREIVKDENQKVNFIIRKDIGIPSLVTRFVNENNGLLYKYDISNKEIINSKQLKGSDNARFNAIEIPYFDKMLPLLVKKEKGVNITMPINNIDRLLDENYDSEISIKNIDNIPFASGLIEFYNQNDNNNIRCIETASIAKSVDLPVINIINNLSESSQLELLFDGYINSISNFNDIKSYNDSLFENKQLKQNWDMQYDYNFDNYATAYSNSVKIKNKDFYTLLGTYCAMSLLSIEDKDVLNYSLNEIKESENNIHKLILVYNNITSKLNIDIYNNENILRSAVELFVKSNPTLSDELIRKTIVNNIVCVKPDFSAYNIVVDNSINNNLNNLFVNENGVGENRLGVVLLHQINIIKQENAEKRRKEENIEKYAVNQFNNASKGVSLKSEVEFITDNMYEINKDSELFKSAFWFMGTNSPLNLHLSDKESVYAYNEDYSSKNPDILNRETASRQYVYTDSGEKELNNLIYLFPTDLTSSMGAMKTKYSPEDKNLTGLTRLDSNNEEFICAYGIAVKRNNLNIEIGNADNRKPSFFYNADSATVLKSILIADSQARKMAIDKNMSLCYPVYEAKDIQTGKYITKNRLNNIFDDKKFDVPVVTYKDFPNWKPENGERILEYQTVEQVLENVKRKKQGLEPLPNPIQLRIGDKKPELLTFTDYTDENGNKGKPVKVLVYEKQYNAKIKRYEYFTKKSYLLRKEKVYNESKHIQEDKIVRIQDGKYLTSKKMLVDNPHASDINKELINNYCNVLLKGANLPLNCFSLPLSDYTKQENKERFVRDFNLSLRLANASAYYARKPLKFFLDKDNLIDLGNNVPKNLREVATNLVNSFYNKEVNYNIGERYFNDIYKIELSNTYKRNADDKSIMQRSGNSIMLKPTDLVFAFGKFDFSGVLQSDMWLMHEMAFMSTDGTIFKLTDNRLTNRLPDKVVNDYLNYSKDDVIKFTLTSTDPKKENCFLSVLKEKLESVKQFESLSVEMKLVAENEVSVDEQTLKGLINVSSTMIDKYELPTGSENIDADYFYRFVYDDNKTSSWQVLQDMDMNSKLDVMAGVVDAKNKKINISYSLEPFNYRRENNVPDNCFIVTLDNQVLPFDKSYDLLNVKYSGQIAFQYEVIGDKKNFKSKQHFISNENQFRDIYNQIAQENITSFNIEYQKNSQIQYVSLLSSNDDSIAEDDYIISNSFADRKNKIDMAFGRPIENNVYYGKVDANDDFKGYALFRVKNEKNDKMSDWIFIENKDLATYVCLTLINREYNSDNIIVPERSALEKMLLCEASKTDVLNTILDKPNIKIEKEVEIKEVTNNASSMVINDDVETKIVFNNKENVKYCNKL